MISSDILRHYLNIMLFGALLIFSGSVVAQQEVCDNGIDDDNDGLVDINDDDCDCQGFSSLVTSIIPNNSFEENTQCPDAQGQLEYAVDWEQASKATTDYIHNCGFTYTSVISPPQPFPDGDACVGMILEGYSPSIEVTVQEYLGSVLNSPLRQDTAYQLDFYVGFGTSIDENVLRLPDDVELGLFGFQTEVNFEIPTWECPTKMPNSQWELISTIEVDVQSDSWVRVSMKFTPGNSYESIILGSVCSDSQDEIGSYIFIDDLILSKKDNFSYDAPQKLGSTCEENLILRAREINISNPDYQWYLDGVALSGETSREINIGNGLGREGDYQVRLTFNGECVTSDPMEVFSNENKLQINGPDYICGDDTITLNAENSEFTEYDWSTGEESSSIEITEGGWYKVEVTSTGGCTYIDSIFIRGPFLISPEADITDTEYGKAEGEIDITLESGNYTFQWSDGADSEDRTTLEAGDYTVTITDENGCSTERTYTIEAIPTKLEVKVDITTPQCHGGSDGSIRLIISGGIPDYEINWKVDGSSSIILDNIESGSYRVSIEDQSGQLVNKSIFVSQPKELIVESEVTNTRCFQGSNGGIKLTALGGTAPYNYSWSHSSDVTDSSAGNLSKGNYSITVSDQNGCTEVLSLEVNEPEELTAEIQSLGLRCYGEDDAEILVKDISGGKGPYIMTFEGKEYKTKREFNNLSAGQYSIMIIDANGCSLEREIVIEDLEEIGVELAIDNSEVVLGEEVLLSSDVYPPTITNYNLEWYSDISGTLSKCNNCNEFSHRPKGTTLYTVFMRHGDCTYESSVNVRVQNIKVFVPNAFTPNGDGTNDELEFFTNSDQDLKIKSFSIFSRTGDRFFNLEDVAPEKATKWDGTFNGRNIKSGLYAYKLILINSHGREYTYSGTIQLIR